jgi:cellulose synthase/poly-beta-1,6-N-acetylglucosamine synthase-like glycosyltransferase
LTVLFVVVGVVYVAASILLVAFGANLAWLSFVASRRAVEPEPEPAPPDPLPRVTVQLPIYNELYVSQRAIEALSRLDYPADRLEIQVLDDSSDETVHIVAAAVEQARALGTDIHHLRRDGRTGFKAGALKEALVHARGELIAVIDADFVPEPDFLRRVIPHFDQPDIGFVQARWGHLNRDYSWLTRLQALAIDGHFLVEQSGRGRRGYWFNFNGTAGVWRRDAIEDAGGWTADTLTEDLDLSYRAHLRGWRGRYLEDVVVPGEVPAHMAGFRRQQHRWARGSLECAVRLVPLIWRSPARIAVKLQATLHLTSYCIHLLLFVLMLLYPAMVLAAAEHPGLLTFFGVAYPIALFSLAPVIFFAVGQHRQDRSWLRELPRILVATVIGSGLMLNTVRAAAQIVLQPDPEFERTAKYGLGPVESSRDTWTRRRYQLGFDRIVWAEAALAGYGLATARLAFQHGNWAVGFYSSLFGVGLLSVAGLTVGQHVAVRRSRLARDRQIRLEDQVLGSSPGGLPASVS